MSGVDGLEELLNKAECSRLGKRIALCEYECYYKRPDHQAVFVEGHDYSRCRHKDVQQLVIPQKDVVEFFKTKVVVDRKQLKDIYSDFYHEFHKEAMKALRELLMGSVVSSEGLSAERSSVEAQK